MNFLRKWIIKISLAGPAAVDHLREFKNAIGQTLFLIGNSPAGWFLFPIVLGILVAIALSVTHALFAGWVTYTLWSWFMLPHGMPAFSYPVFVGAALIMIVLQRREFPWNTLGTPEVIMMILRRFTTPIGMLFIGWVTQLGLKVFVS